MKTKPCHCTNLDNLRCHVSEEGDGHGGVGLDAGPDGLLKEPVHVENVPEVESRQTGVVLHHLLDGVRLALVHWTQAIVD